MSDFSNLSKEEQEIILRMRKKTVKPSENEKKRVHTDEKKPIVICSYVAGKGGKEKCANNSETPYGFCKNHIRTVQAKKAREEYEISNIVGSDDDEEQEVQPKVEKKPLNKKSEVQTVNKKSEVQTVNKKSEVQPKEEKTPVSKKFEVQPKEEKTPVSKNSEQDRVESKKSVNQQSHHKEIIRAKKIHPNHWGRYEDPVTHIVFDKNTKEAYGVQQASGKVDALKPEHVQICIRNKWNYNLPYASDDEESDSIHDSDFDEDENEELSDSEDEIVSDDLEDSSDEEDDDDKDLDDSDEDDELVDSDENDSEDEDSDEDDSDEDDDSDDDSDESR